jgi:hypothetical protein
LIIRDRRGLAGLVATAADRPADSEEIRTLVSRHWIAGLKRMYVIAGRGDQERIAGSGSADSLVWLASPGPPKQCLASARPAPELQPAGLSD